jgi:ribosome recycling factor
MNTNDLKSKLTKSIEFLKTELSQIRTGRATPALLDPVLVDAYGTKMSVKELGSIVVLDPQNLAVTPWDHSVLSSIAKSIREGGLGLNPVEESDRVRVPVPSLTEERRRDYQKMVSQKVEDCKNAMRSIRQDAMKDIERAFTDKEISEDDKFSQKEEVEKTVKTFTEESESIGEEKKQELMTV